jgi:hypothetical protein
MVASDVASRTRRLRQVADVLLAAPLFIIAPLLRPWHLRWGTRADEVAEAMPGDAQQPAAQFVATRAIDIDAPPEAVWPWIVQIGWGRAGFYSYDLLDGLGRPSADRVVPEWQDLAIGDWVAMSPTVNDTTAFRVGGFEQPHWLLWAKPDSTWAWRLRPAPGGGTRLVSRLRCTYDVRRPALALLSIVLIEFGDFAMFRKMLKGIRVRASRSSPA